MIQEPQIPEAKPNTVLMADIPIKQIPPFRYRIAKSHNIKQILMTTWGGLGDQICGEPALRYAFKLFPDHEISLLTSYPELFEHLPFKRIFNKKLPSDMDLLRDRDDEWLMINTNPPHGNLERDFITHHFTQVVDFSTLCAFQRQIPVKDREIKLVGTKLKFSPQPLIVIHPGKHWTSKTFPQKWWEEVIAGAYKLSHHVAVIGQDMDKETGIVPVNLPDGIMDLRNKLRLPELVTVCQNAHVIVTNDSAPLHIAASGQGHILFIASCKESEYLMHWRNKEFGWRMKNLGLDGIWNYQDSCPIREKALTIEHATPEMIAKILPSPKYVIDEIWNALK